MTTEVIVANRKSDWMVGTAYTGTTARTPTPLIAAAKVEDIPGAIRLDGAPRVEVAIVSTEAENQTVACYLSFLNRLTTVLATGQTVPAPTPYFVEKLRFFFTATIGARVGLSDAMVPTTGMRWAKGVTISGAGSGGAAATAPEAYSSPAGFTSALDDAAWVQFLTGGALAMRLVIVNSNADKESRALVRAMW